MWTSICMVFFHILYFSFIPTMVDYIHVCWLTSAHDRHTSSTHPHNIKKQKNADISRHRHDENRWLQPPKHWSMWCFQPFSVSHCSQITTYLRRTPTGEHPAHPKADFTADTTHSISSKVDSNSNAGISTWFRMISNDESLWIYMRFIL